MGAGRGYDPDGRSVALQSDVKRRIYFLLKAERQLCGVPHAVTNLFHIKERLNKAAMLNN